MCLFCDFVSGRKKKHWNDLPFIIVNQSENTISFLSKSCPDGKKSHILVIPKLHYKNFNELSTSLRSELIEQVNLATIVIKKKYEGCNILINDGKAADQQINHVHFHIIPRNSNDGYILEGWPKIDVDKETFVNLSNKIK
ncbi:MAG: HIT family protein [archaeon]